MRSNDASAERHAARDERRCVVGDVARAAQVRDDLRRATRDLRTRRDVHGKARRPELHAGARELLLAVCVGIRGAEHVVVARVDVRIGPGTPNGRDERRVRLADLAHLVRSAPAPAPTPTPASGRRARRASRKPPREARRRGPWPPIGRSSFENSAPPSRRERRARPRCGRAFTACFSVLASSAIDEENPRCGARGGSAHRCGGHREGGTGRDAGGQDVRQDE